MSIQSNINTALSLASVLASQNPTLKGMAEDRRMAQSLAEREKAVNKAIEATGSDIAAKEAYGEELTGIKKQQFELKPTPESFKAYKDLQPRRVMEAEADPDEIAMEIYESEQRAQDIRSEVDRLHASTSKAREALMAKQEEKRGSRRKFTDYMKDEPTSLGESFGELDPKLQQAIAKQYKSKERKSIMDRKDASNGK